MCTNPVKLFLRSPITFRILGNWLKLINKKIPELGPVPLQRSLMGLDQANAQGFGPATEIGSDRSSIQPGPLTLSETASTSCFFGK